MAVVSRVSTLKFDNGLGSSRTWQSTAAVQDTAAGGSVVITTTEVGAGATPPDFANTLTLNVYNDNNVLVRTFALTTGVASQTNTLHFTADGTSTGAARCGTLSLDIRATRTTGGPTSTYDYETDGAPATSPSTFTATQVDRGWVRGTATSTQVLSNVSLGGAKSSPASYSTVSAGDGGDSLFVRTTLGAATFVARTLTTTVSGPTAGPLSAATNSTTGPVFDTTFTRVVDNRFPAAVTAAVTGVTIPNATLTGQPFTVLTNTTDTINVDPRLTRTPLFQLDDNTFGTPPLSKDFPSHQRQTTQQGFLASRTTNARGEGVNGVTYTVTLTPRRPGTPATQSGLVTQAQGGQDGWAPSFLPWAAGLPGGIWDKTATYTAPADITGASYVVQLAGTSTEYILTARNDNLLTASNVQHEPGLGDRHYTAGMALIASAYLVDSSTRIRTPFASLTSMEVGVVRVANAANPDGTGASFEYLNSSGAWVAWGGGARDTFAMSVSSADSTVGERRFVTDSTWGVRDIRFVMRIVFEGVAYTNDLVVINVGTANGHQGYELDAAGLALTGGITFK